MWRRMRTGGRAQGRGWGGGWEGDKASRTTQVAGRVPSLRGGLLGCWRPIFQASEGQDLFVAGAASCPLPAAFGAGVTLASPREGGLGLLVLLGAKEQRAPTVTPGMHCYVLCANASSGGARPGWLGSLRPPWVLEAKTSGAGVVLDLQMEIPFLSSWCLQTGPHYVSLCRSNCL